MECAILGMVSLVSSYKSKQTDKEVYQVHVGSGEQMLQVKVDDPQNYHKYQLVVLLCDASPNGREIWVKNGRLRPATASDRQFFGFGDAVENSPSYEMGVAA